MQDDDAIGGLKQLGLTTYEARVFLGLQKLGSATASDVADITDVPRSQVYGAAEGLEERGLVETQQSTPTVYRPVPLEQARTQLLDQLAKAGSRTFDYLESIKDTAERSTQAESIWMVNGTEAISSRAVSLITDADETVLYGVDDHAFLTQAVLDALSSATNDGVTTVVSSTNQEVLDKAQQEGLNSYRVPEERDLNVSTARFLLTDSDTILLSTHSGPKSAGEEVAFWTAENAFAAILGELASAWLQEPFEDRTE